MAVTSEVIVEAENEELSSRARRFIKCCLI